MIWKKECRTFEYYDPNEWFGSCKIEFQIGIAGINNSQLLWLEKQRPVV